MREKKFRAWHLGQKKMFTAEEMSEDQLTLLTTGYFINVSGIATTASVIYGHDKMLPLQFTGLHDKNGKEIYEGDIVVKPYVDPMGGLHRETEDGRYKVGFEYGQFVLYRTEPQPLIKWCEKEKGDYVSNYGNLTIIKDTTVLEVIGNIYENPELLK